MSKGRFDFVTIVWSRVTRLIEVRVFGAAMRGSLPAKLSGAQNEIS